MGAKLVLALIGAGGFGREVKFYADLLIERQIVNQLVFVESQVRQPRVEGVEVISLNEFFKLDKNSTVYNIPIADSKIRAKISEQVLGEGFSDLPIIAPSALMHKGTKLGVGPIICHGTIITSNVSIGDFFHANINSYVAHDCSIGNYVTFAPRVICNGGVEIEDHVYVGAGASIIQSSSNKSIRIGHNSIIGMGSVVTKSVPPGVVVVGNPARVSREL